jgi:hypothetical protein
MSQVNPLEPLPQGERYILVWEPALEALLRYLEQTSTDVDTLLLVQELRAAQIGGIASDATAT